jgi:site-specific DNA-methyltransferase (adenine-specific)
VIIPFEKLWEQYKRIIKDKGNIILFANEPFASLLRTSNMEMYRYDWIWNKGKPSNFQLMNYQCGRVQELILVFSKAKACYTKNGNSMLFNPQMEDRDKPRTANAKIYGSNNLLHDYDTKDNIKTYDKRYPISIINFKPVYNNKLHPTQKPIDLLEYLIKSYTNEDEKSVIMDNCMGSGSTGVACINTNRKFIGIEMNNKYYEIACKRIEDAKACMEK